VRCPKQGEDDMKKEDWKKETAGMASKLNGVLSSLSEHIEFIYDNEEDFLEEFARGKFFDLIEVTFGSGHIRISYLLEDGPTVTDGIDMDKFIDWAAR
jgi:hypothetical protein